MILQPQSHASTFFCGSKEINPVTSKLVKGVFRYHVDFKMKSKDFERLDNDSEKTRRMLKKRERERLLVLLLTDHKQGHLLP